MVCGGMCVCVCEGGVVCVCTKEPQVCKGTQQDER